MILVVMLDRLIGMIGKSRGKVVVSAVDRMVGTTRTTTIEVLIQGVGA